MAKLRRTVAGTLVLDAEGLSKLSAGDPALTALFLESRRLGSKAITAASTLAEVLRGGARDAAVHHVLRHITVAELSQDHGRRAGELLGETGLPGHRCALDALLAVIALAQRRPVILATSDPKDMERLTEEPHRRKSDRIRVIRV